MKSVYRNRLELYCDILESIQKRQQNPKTKQTTIQKDSRMSYDKFVRHMNELKKNNLIIRDMDLKVSAKGYRFIQDCKMLKKQITKMHEKYL